MSGARNGGRNSSDTGVSRRSLIIRPRETIIHPPPISRDFYSRVRRTSNRRRRRPGRPISKITRGGRAGVVTILFPRRLPLSRRCRITDPTSCEWRYHAAFGAFDASGGFMRDHGNVWPRQPSQCIRYSILRLCLPTGTPRWLAIRIHPPDAEDDTGRSRSHATREIQSYKVYTCVKFGRV